MKNKLPLSLKILIGYFIITGVLGLIWPLTGFGPHHSEFEAMSTASKTGVYFRDSIINILFIVSGVALLNRKAWGRTVGLVVLSISLIYSGNQFAWGLMQGSPTVKAYLVSYGVVGVWVSIWFYILFKSSSKIALKSNSEGSVDEYS